MPVQVFRTSVLAALRAMDVDAGEMVGGRPAGLQGYQHAKTASNRWEEACSQSLADRISGCLTECKYPRSRRRCDLVVEIRRDLRIWLEVKFAWKHYLWNGLLKPNRAYRKHLTAAVKDVRKLSTLPPSVAQHVGLLLVGFDTQLSPMDADIDKFALDAGLGSMDWSCGRDVWDDPRVLGHRTHACLWTRPNRTPAAFGGVAE